MGRRNGRFRLRRWAPVQFALYLLLRAAISAIALCPDGRAPRLARLLGRLALLIDRRHARVARKNLENTRGLCPPERIPAFIGRVYENVALLCVEMVLTDRSLRSRRLEERSSLERFHVVNEVLSRGRGMIVVIGHLGNWELIGLAVTRSGIPLHSIARPVENPWVDRWLTRFRTRTGQEIIPKRRALGSMVRALRRNETLIIQVDQDARREGVIVDFLGRPASTHRSPAVLALKYGTPIVVADIYRAGGLHHCVLSDPILPEDFRDAADPVRALTQAYTARVEECVRAHPDQWFWVHDRWKSVEPAPARERTAPIRPRVEEDDVSRHEGLPAG